MFLESVERVGGLAGRGDCRVTATDSAWRSLIRVEAPAWSGDTSLPTPRPCFAHRGGGHPRGPAVTLGKEQQSAGQTGFSDSVAY